MGTEKDEQNKVPSKVGLSYEWQPRFRKQFNFYSYAKGSFTHFVKELLNHSEIEMSNPNLIRDETNSDLILKVNFQIKTNENDSNGIFFFAYFLCRSWCFFSSLFSFFFKVTKI